MTKKTLQIKYENLKSRLEGCRSEPISANSIVIQQEKESRAEPEPAIVE